LSESAVTTAQLPHLGPPIRSRAHPTTFRLVPNKFTTAGQRIYRYVVQPTPSAPALPSGRAEANSAPYAPADPAHLHFQHRISQSCRRQGPQHIQTRLHRIYLVPAGLTHYYRSEGAVISQPCNCYPAGPYTALHEIWTDPTVIEHRNPRGQISVGPLSTLPQADTSVAVATTRPPRPPAPVFRHIAPAPTVTDPIPPAAPVFRPIAPAPVVTNPVVIPPFQPVEADISDPLWSSQESWSSNQSPEAIEVDSDPADILISGNSGFCSQPLSGDSQGDLAHYGSPYNSGYTSNEFSLGSPWPVSDPDSV
jgi:hypothetical protein